MTEAEARLILQCCRPGVEDHDDPQFAEARRMAAADPALAQWWEEEQAFDRAIVAQLDAVPEPFGLKTRILARSTPPATSRFARWVVGLTGAAALLFLLAQVADLWRHAAPGSSGLLEYASEMVSFVKVPPSLEMESADLGAINSWLAQKEAIAPDLPNRVAALKPVGCRVLSFRGREVTLVCFHRPDGGLAHLFVVDRAALPDVKPGSAVAFQKEGEWTTATWAAEGKVYMIAVQGNEAAARELLPSA